MKKHRIVILLVFSSIVISMLVLEKREKNDMRKVLVPENNKIYFAAFPDFGGAENIVSQERIRSFENLASKKIAWAAFSQHWFEGLAYPKVQIQTIKDAGSMPYVRFLPRSGLEQFKVEKKFTLEKIINGDFDKQLKAWAKSANDHNVPIIIDFALEMNGDWFGWSGSFNGANAKAPEMYRNAYRHIIDIFRAQNVHHVTWFFHPNIKSHPNVAWNLPKHYYPGDDYIDWIGISIYGAIYEADYPKGSYWDTFDETLKENYQEILNISTTKPLAILEMGVTDYHPSGEKSQWLKDAFEIILSQKYLDFKAINYWHESWDNDGVFASLRIDSSTKSLRAFQEAVQNDRFTSNIKLSDEQPKNKMKGKNE